jgi:hypothetical protein
MRFISIATGRVVTFHLGGARITLSTADHRDMYGIQGIDLYGYADPTFVDNSYELDAAVAAGWITNRDGDISSGPSLSATPTPTKRNYSTLTFHASGAETSSGVGSDIDVSTCTEGILFLNVTGFSGTVPSMVVVMTSKDPVGGGYHELSRFATMASGSLPMKTFMQLSGALGDKVRAEWTLTGSNPSFTFSVVGAMK